MRICDICKKNSMAFTTWTPNDSKTEMCYKCYRVWNEYQDKAFKEAYRKLKAKVQKENDDEKIH